MPEGPPAAPRDQGSSLATRLLGGGGRGARAVAQATGIDEALDLAAEEAIVRALESAAVQRALGRVLEREAEEGAVQRLLDSPALERTLAEALESELVDRLWEQMLASDLAQKLVERIAEAPEVRSAIAMQGVGLVEDLGRQIGRVAARLDDAAERVARAFLRRPRRTEPTERAGVVSRALALVFDGALLNLVFVAVTALITFVVSAAFGADGAPAPVIALGGVAWALASGSYLVFFWTLAGQTPGMRLLGIRLDRGDGVRQLGFRQAMRRLAGVVISIAALGLGFLAILVSDRRQGWHDRLARTEVVRDERRLTAPWAEPVAEPEVV
jgi:uncharacterized RDD family membrane protein YckC